MTGRHMARADLISKARAWAAGFKGSKGAERLNSAYYINALADDLEALIRPRQVIRTLAQLQALPAGTKLAVQGDRAAQVEGYEDVDENGELIEVKKLIYVGTDLDDYLTPPDRINRDTLDILRRMLPAIVIDPLD